MLRCNWLMYSIAGMGAEDTPEDEDRRREEEPVGGGGGGEEGEGNKDDRIGVTRYRWVILAIFSLQNLVNSILWICFGMLHFMYFTLFIVHTSHLFF